jgi:hypothetical protein
MNAQRLSLFLCLGMGSSDGIEASKGVKPVSDETPPDGWPPKPAELGAGVRRARERARLPRRRLSALVGVSETTIDNIENGIPCRCSTRQYIVQTFLVLSFGRIGERQS